MSRRALFFLLALTAVVAVSAIVGARVAVADGDCNVPLANWKPVAELDALAKAQGWNIARVKTDDGCYEIRGTDRDGRRFKAKVDPSTLEIIRLKADNDHRYHRHRERAYRDTDDEGEDEHRRDAFLPGGANRNANGTAASGPAPAEGVLKPGAKPQAQIQ